MIYQDLLCEEFPYIAESYQNCSFDMHYHHEIELIYCVRGKGFKILTTTTEYTVNAGNLIFISSLMPHRAIPIPDENSEIFLIRVGPAFLHNTFFDFAALSFKNPVLDLSCDKEEYKKLLSYLEFLIACSRDKTKYSTLMSTGILYQLCATLLCNIPQSEKDKNSYFHKFNFESKIEDIIRYITLHYNEKITIETAADICGYSKTNFCNVFKKQTGSTFHQYLNNFRIKNAKFLLKSSTMPIGEIGNVCGFEEAKTFCRQFKESTGKTPGQYRAESSPIYTT